MTWVLALTFVTLFVVERLLPARVQPETRGWWRRALVLNGIVVVFFFAAETWDPWLHQHRLSDALGELPAPLGGLIGFVAFQFAHYWWHRARHGSDFLWRWVHQVHHSARRLEVLTASYTHPLDGLAYIALLSGVSVGLLGLSLEAAQWAILLDTFYNYFIHSNLRAPYWLGYIIQRPEMHRVHHQYGVHAYNYALPVWDMLFGTHFNPRPDEEAQWCGFDAEKSDRVGEMLLGTDVHSVPAAPSRAART